MENRLRDICYIEDLIKLQRPNCITLKAGTREVKLCIKGKEKSFKQIILEHSKCNYYANGVFNEKRNCYYPICDSNKEIAEYKKLEKLFKKYGFKKL